LSLSGDPGRAGPGIAIGVVFYALGRRDRADTVTELIN
jgi:hypothetical protein